MSKIHGNLIALRDIIGGLQAKKTGGVMYPVKSAKDLMLKLRRAQDELHMVMAGAPVSQTVSHIKDFYDKNGNNILVCHVITTVRFMSDDGSYVDFVGSGYGSSSDDKAGGKASTYAWKDAIVKALSLPDDEMLDTDDESNDMSRQSKVGPFVDAIVKCRTIEDGKEAYKVAVTHKWSPTEYNMLNDAVQRLKSKLSNKDK